MILVGALSHMQLVTPLGGNTSAACEVQKTEHPTQSCKAPTASYRASSFIFHDPLVVFLYLLDRMHCRTERAHEQHALFTVSMLPYTEFCHLFGVNNTHKILPMNVV